MKDMVNRAGFCLWCIVAIIASVGSSGSKHDNLEALCGHCTRNPAQTFQFGVWMYGNNVADPQPSVSVTGSVTGGNDGQCVSTGCSHVACKWIGFVTVTNSHSGTISVEIFLAGTKVKDCDNVGAGQTCQWTISGSGALETLEVNCGSASAQKELKIIIIVDGKTYSSAINVVCNQCSAPGS